MKNEQHSCVDRRPHLGWAHAYWRQLLRPGDTVIDATCGNGHDSLALAQLVLSLGEGGSLIAIDRQAEAIEATHRHLAAHLPSALLHQIRFFNQSHVSFPNQILPASVALIVYNLGYLPGGNKTLTTLSATTVQSLETATNLVRPGGAICVTCYPGHPGGKEEEAAVVQFASSLSKLQWHCCHHQWVNRSQAPSVVIARQRDLGQKIGIK